MTEHAGAERAGDPVATLRDVRLVRERAHVILDLARAGKLEHWQLHEEKMPALADFVVDVIRAQYPDITKIPYHSRWRHFEAGGVDRRAILRHKIGAGGDRMECARTEFDLVITSVLLDAGAGKEWQYREEGSGKIFTRSEGLGVASFWLFVAGAFSSDSSRKLQANAEGLRRFNAATLAKYFQVSHDNPLTGLEGRAALLAKLGDVMSADTGVFGSPARLGNLVDNLVAHAQDGAIGADVILRTILDTTSDMWANRPTLNGTNLGDVWRHGKLEGPGATSGFMPIHKLSQWLTYSLLEPLETLGLKIANMETLTGLAEYRNGGLLVDFGVLEPRNSAAVKQALKPEDELIVEWRALTIALLDELAILIRQKLKLSAAEFPLAKVLEGGTWAAGRQIAKSKRADGSPPFNIVSDGTVF